MIAALLGLLVPTALLYAALAPRPPRRLLHVGLAMGLAAGLTSALWFAWFAVFDSPGWLYFAAETALLSLVALWRRRTAAPPSAPSPASPPASGPMRFAGAILALLTLSGLLTFAVNTARQPHGSWDAVAIWNLHARFLAAGAERWGALMRDGNWCAYHGDYPLLLPGCIARLWGLAGAPDERIAALVALWFAAATVLLCGGLVAQLRGTSQGLLAALALLGTGAFVSQSSDQYADLPLAWCIAAALGALALHRLRAGGAPWLTICGVTTALAAWTKNEGLLFAAVLPALLAAASARRLGPRGALREALPLLAGMLPLLMLVAYFKLALAPVNDLVAGQGIEATVARLFDVGRYATIAGGLLAASVRTLKALLFALPLYYLLMGRTGLSDVRQATGIAGAVLGIMLLGYIGVYLTTPFDVEWHIQTSAKRLLLQLWPAAVMAFFLIVAAPEERFSE